MNWRKARYLSAFCSSLSIDWSKFVGMLRKRWLSCPSHFARYSNVLIFTVYHFTNQALKVSRKSNIDYPLDGQWPRALNLLLSAITSTSAPAVLSDVDSKFSLCTKCAAFYTFFPHRTLKVSWSWLATWIILRMVTCHWSVTHTLWICEVWS